MDNGFKDHVSSTIDHLRAVASDLADSMNVNPGILEFRVHPTEDQKDTKRPSLFSRQACFDLTEYLVSKGFKQTSDFDLTQNERVRRFIPEQEMSYNASFAIQIHYNDVKSKKERCAELMQELEELGCEDVCGKGDFVPSGNVD